MRTTAKTKTKGHNNAKLLQSRRQMWSNALSARAAFELEMVTELLVSTTAKNAGRKPTRGLISFVLLLNTSGRVFGCCLNLKGPTLFMSLGSWSCSWSLCESGCQPDRSLEEEGQRGFPKLCPPQHETRDRYCAAGLQFVCSPFVCGLTSGNNVQPQTWWRNKKTTWTDFVCHVFGRRFYLR